MREKMIWSRRTRGLSWCWDGKEVCSTPVRWSSSERPLSVRTIWIGSVRHAILSTDDPLLQYQGQSYCQRRGSSSISSESETSSVASNELEECLIKLRVALDSSEKNHLPPIETTSPKSSPSSPLEDQSSCSSPTAIPVLPQNPLSERVLQWLDLASKGHTTTTTLLPKRSRNISSCVSKPSQTKKRLHTRSATIDMPQISKNKSPVSCHKADDEEIYPTPYSASPVIKEEEVQQPEIQSRVVVPQRYEPLRPLTTWASNTKPSRPQLHIFIPPTEHATKSQADIFDDTTCINE